jgi:tetratricopeptide (TPR) repeat protein
VWAGRFDREYRDLLDIEAAIADTVATEVAGRLLPRERGQLASGPTRDPQAYDRFLHGNFSLARRTAEDIRTAIRDYEAAVALDPHFAAAQARIALAYGIVLDWGWTSFDTRSAIRLGLAASARAIEMDSNLADAWTARGYILRFANARTYAGVAEAFRRAVALNPRDPEAPLQFGWALAAMGEPRAAIATLQRAVALDPERAIAHFTLAWVLIQSGRARDALPTLDTAIAFDAAVPNLHGMRAWARLLTGDTSGARADIAREQVGDIRISGSALAALSVVAGDSSAARGIADRMVAELPPAPAPLNWGASWAALACAAARQADRAMDLLERIEPQGLTVWGMLNHPGFDAIRTHPRFERFYRELAPPGAH